jgi:CrcB protein
MGALTTFSTYVFESGQMMRDSEWLLAGGNFVAQNVLGLFCLYLGTVLARLV